MKPFEREWIERADALSCLFVLFLISISPISTPIWRHFTQCTDSKLTQNTANMSTFGITKYWLALQGETECIDLNKFFSPLRRWGGCFGQQLQRGRGHIGQHSPRKGSELSSLSQNILTDTHRQTHILTHTHRERGVSSRAYLKTSSQRRKLSWLNSIDSGSNEK